MRLEALAASGPPAAPWPEASLPAEPKAPSLPSASLLRWAAERLAAGESRQSVASGFHSTFCALAAELLVRVAPARTGEVALGGGCLANRLLRQGLSEALSLNGFEPLLPVSVPPGDGGLAYGQTVLASVALASGFQEWLPEGI